MKNRKNSFWVVLFVAVSVFTGYISFAEGTGPEDRWKKWRKKKEAWTEELYEEVKVTPQQKEKLAQLRDENREKTGLLRKKMVEAKDRLHAALKQEELDMKEVYVVVDILKSISAELVEQRVDNFLDMREVLTTEQFGKILDVKDASMEGHRKAR